MSQGFLDVTTVWWLDQQTIIFVVPAKTNMAVTADARAQAAADEGLTLGRRGHTVRPEVGTRQQVLAKHRLPARN